MAIGTGFGLLGRQRNANPFTGGLPTGVMSAAQVAPAPFMPLDAPNQPLLAGGRSLPQQTQNFLLGQLAHLGPDAMGAGASQFGPAPTGPAGPTGPLGPLASQFSQLFVPRRGKGRTGRTYTGPERRVNRAGLGGFAGGGGNRQKGPNALPMAGRGGVLPATNPFLQ